MSDLKRDCKKLMVGCKTGKRLGRMVRVYDSGTKGPGFETRKSQNSNPYIP